VPSSLGLTDAAPFSGSVLQEFIISNHSKDEAKKLDDPIRAVNASRQQLVQALERADSGAALQACQSYLSTFLMLSTQFPWGDHKRDTFLGFKTGKSTWFGLGLLCVW
jgi:hypothetical protein